MNVMIVVPHPDDEVLGFGGIIQKHVKRNDNVFVYFMADISMSPRTQKQVDQFPQVAEKLGCFGKACNTFITERNFVPNVRILEDEIHNFKPDVLYSVFNGDNHQDHEYMFKVLRIATRVYAPFLVKKIYLGEILSSTDQSPKLPEYTFIPNHYVPLSIDEIMTKTECLEYYTDEIQQWPHPRSKKGILNLAEKRGSECGQLYAESFITLRNIDSL